MKNENMLKKINKDFYLSFTGFILVITGFFFFVFEFWFSWIFSGMGIESILFHLKFPLNTVFIEQYYSAFFYFAMWFIFSFFIFAYAFDLYPNISRFVEKQKILSLLISLIPFLLCIFIPRALIVYNIEILIYLPLFMYALIFFRIFFMKEKKFLFFDFLQKNKSYILFISGVIIFLLSIIKIEKTFHVSDFIRNARKTNTLFETYYTNPATNEFIFPEKKRNLVILFLESIEKAYQEPLLFGHDLIPELTQLQKGNIVFHNFRQVKATNWTSAALTAFLYGMPRLDLWNLRNRDCMKVFPKSAMLLNILGEHGYHGGYVQGTTIDFAGMDLMLRRHPSFIIRGYAELEAYRKENNMKDVYFQERIYNDKNLYIFAKHIISKLAKQGEPFCELVAIFNTHGPCGYLEKNRDSSPKDYRFVLKEASEMAYEFVQWIRKQPFGPDTTIIILGDHIVMSNTLTNSKKSVEKEYFKTHPREIYNCVINPHPSVKKPKDKKAFASFDLAPTILECLGVRWSSRKIGIGTSLFSDQKGILEEMTVEEFNRRAGGYSVLYTKLLTGDE